MTPNEILNRYWLARIIGWRHELELLDAETVAILIKALKSANNLLRQKIADELPAVWDNYTAEKGGAAVRLWLGDLLTDPANQIENTITEAWALSGQSSLSAYNDILSVNGLAKNVETVPVTMEAIRGLADKKLFAGYTLGQLVAKSFTEGQITTIIDALDNGIKQGLSYPKVIKDVEQKAIDAGAEINRRQSITLARSYIQQASVNAQLAVYERNKRLIKGVKWCAILDNRICELCAATDSLSYTWDEERPPMPRHPRCLLPYTLVSASDAIAGFVAEYDGPVYDFELYNGTEFSITENHPILTEKGFLPACEIDKDTRIFCNDYEKGRFSAKSIKEIVGEMRCYDDWGNKIHEFEEIKVSKDGFHGDGQYCTQAGFIDIIPSGWDEDNIHFYNNPLNDLFLMLECDKRIMSASEAWHNQYDILQKWHKKYENRGFALFGYKSKIKRHYKGPVFDLQTLSSMYYADGAIVSNCRCLWLPWIKSWRELGIDADELEKAARPWLIREEGNIDAGGRKILYAGTSKEDFPGWWKTLPYEQQIKSIGPVRTQLINSGKLTWKDLMNKNTGQFYTLKELGFTESGKPLL